MRQRGTYVEAGSNPEGSASARNLLAHYHADAATPAFGQAYAHNFQMRSEVPQQDVCCGMKTQCRSDEINQWRRVLELDAGKISVTVKIALLGVTFYSQPIVRRLERQVNVLAGFQLDDSETTGARDG